jgi:hypothetical protein
MLKKVLHSRQHRYWLESKTLSLSDPVLGLTILWVSVIVKRQQEFILKKKPMSMGMECFVKHQMLHSRQKWVGTVHVLCKVFIKMHILLSSFFLCIGHLFAE